MRKTQRKGVSCFETFHFPLIKATFTSIFSLNTDSFEKLYIELEIVLYHGLKTPRHREVVKVPMQRNFQVGDNNIKVMFDIASLDCESLRMNNEIEVCLFSA